MNCTCADGNVLTPSRRSRSMGALFASPLSDTVLPLYCVFQFLLASQVFFRFLAAGYVVSMAPAVLPSADVWHRTAMSRCEAMSCANAGSIKPRCWLLRACFRCRRRQRERTLRWFAPLTVFNSQVLRTAFSETLVGIVSKVMLLPRVVNQAQSNIKTF